MAEVACDFSTLVATMRRLKPSSATSRRAALVVRHPTGPHGVLPEARGRPYEGAVAALLQVW
jgi:hypothetical protein